MFHPFNYINISWGDGFLLMHPVQSKTMCGHWRSARNALKDAALKGDVLVKLEIVTGHNIKRAERILTFK